MINSHDITEKKKIIGCIIAVFVLGIVLLVMDYLETQRNFTGVLYRNDAEDGSYSQKLLFEAGEYASDIEITIDSIRITEEQAKALFEEAKKEIDVSFLGENASPDFIVSKLEFRDSYANGLVEARWQLDSYDVVNTDGSIVEEKTTAEGTMVNALVYLNVDEYQELYSLSFMVYEPVAGTYESFLKALKKSISDEADRSAEEVEFVLPGIVEEKEVVWKKPMDYRGLQIMILGLLTGGAIVVGSRQEQKKNAAKLIADKTKDYPEIVSNLSILMGAGISFKGAIERMCKRYVSKKRSEEGYRREGYEELVKTYHEMKDGVGELEAIEHLGIRSGCKEFRKLSMLLSQNLRKGSRELIDMLEKEEAIAFELRKQLALKAGEEASTKLLIPLLGMLGIVVVILIVPATMQMNM